MQFTKSNSLFRASMSALLMIVLKMLDNEKSGCLTTSRNGQKVGKYEYEICSLILTHDLNDITSKTITEWFHHWTTQQRKKFLRLSSKVTLGGINFLPEIILIDFYGKEVYKLEILYKIFISLTVWMIPYNFILQLNGQKPKFWGGPKLFVCI